MSCPRCRRAAADGDRFCGGCGVELAVECGRCGRELPGGAGYCTGCGAARGELADLSNVATMDRRRVSVLFLDLVDFTHYAEQADPELVRQMQIRFYTTARRVITHHGGVVEKYIGDAVMALFGAPVATETDAVRCVRAGLELQRALSKVDVHDSDPAGKPRCRAGVATGEALVDLAAARNGGQAIAAGDVVNTASRLQSVAPAGGVLVCGQTRALTADAISYAARPPVTLRGRVRPTEVWLALAPAQRPGPVADAVALVDREHELSLLTNALQRTVRDRTPQLVTIFGQAGIGKSRLVRELHRHAEQCVDEPVTWHTGHCPPFGENVTYSGLADIVKAEAGLSSAVDNDPTATAHARLVSATRELVSTEDADRLAAALGRLVGLSGGELPAREAESAWRRFLVALAARGPTVLVFEDLHWADEPMLRFIELLAAAARDVPLLLLTTARPELIERDTSWAGTIAGSLTITLSPLRPASVATLYQRLLGEIQCPPEILTALVDLAAGNPLYAQEYVRMLIERGTLGPPGGSPPAAGQLELPTPDSVHAVIANRVDLLEPAERAALQAAAVVGMQFWPGAVAAALGRTTAPVEELLRRLEQREFIAEQPESSVAGQSEYRFRHVLVRDVCYQRLPRTERVARHERAAEWLETLTQHHDTDLAEVLAHHRWAAHEIARTIEPPRHSQVVAARRALYRAARRAYHLHALETAAGYADRSRSLYQNGPADNDPERLRVELLATEISFYRDPGNFRASGGTGRLASLADQLAAAGAAGDAARAWTVLCQAAWLRMDRTSALAHLERAVTLFDQLPDSPEKIEAYAELGRLHMFNYEREPAVAAAEMAAAIAARLDLPEALANARITIATASYDAGDPAALAQLREITEHCRSRQLLALPRATQNLANALLEEGQWERSIALVTACQSQVQGGHNLATGYSTEALRAYNTGDLAAFIAAVDAAAETPGGRWDIRIRGLRSFVRELRCEPAGNDDEVAAGLALARESRFHRTLWIALSHAALCRALQGRPVEAAALLDELTDAWQKVPVMASGAWVGAAAHAAALLSSCPAGQSAARALHSALAGTGRRTRWSEAALHMAGAAVALADGDPAHAADGHLAAAAVYARIPARTDRAVALAMASAALHHAGRPRPASDPAAEVRRFATGTGAVKLTRIAEGGSADQLRW